MVVGSAQIKKEQKLPVQSLKQYKMKILFHKVMYRNQIFQKIMTCVIHLNARKGVYAPTKLPRTMLLRKRCGNNYNSPSTGIFFFQGWAYTQGFNESWFTFYLEAHERSRKKLSVKQLTTTRIMQSTMI